MNSYINGENQPLRGDGQGRFHIRITGNSGAGKSTLSEELSLALGNAPIIHLDEIYWQPGWTEASTKDFNSKLRDFLRKNQHSSWIIDGNYGNRIDWRMKELRGITDIIWLDPPFPMYFWRLVGRTMRRLFGLEPPCSEGCPETWSEAFFSKSSIFWWCITNHRRLKQNNDAQMKKAEGGKTRWMKLTGWDVTQRKNDWLDAVRRMVKQV